MPVPVFEIPNPEKTAELNQGKKEENKSKISGLAIFLSIIFAALMIMTVELAMRDINSKLNPQYQKCLSKKSGAVLFLAPKKVPAGCDLRQLESLRLIFHADVIIPIIILSFLIYLFIRRRGRQGYFRILFIAYSVFLLWLLLRIIAESEYFLLKYHPLLGKYVMLLSIMVMLVILVVFVQKKFQKKI